MVAVTPLLNSPERVITPSNHASSEKRKFSDFQDSQSTVYDEVVHYVQPQIGDNAYLDIVCYEAPHYCEDIDRSYFELMEVSSVIINQLTVDQLYGEIKIYGDVDGGLSLFERENPSDDITTFTNDMGQTELLLTGPDQSILMIADRLRVSMEFKGLDNKAYTRFVPFGQLGETTYTIYDRLMSATIRHAAFGSITINYKVFVNSVAAKVEVLLMDTNISVDDVLGEIYAYNSVHEPRSCLFHKTNKRNGMCVTPDNGKRIPLSRSVVALPWHADLILDLDLKDSNTGLAIVKTDSVSFTVPEELCIAKTIKSPHMRFPQSLTVSEKILVRVTFALCFEPWHKEVFMSEQPASSI